MTIELAFTLAIIPFMVALVAGTLGTVGWCVVVLWRPWKGDW
mgnify:CR=1 FL=1